MGNWMTCFRSRNEATKALIEKVYKSAVAALNGKPDLPQHRRITIEASAVVSIFRIAAIMARNLPMPGSDQAMVFLPRARSCPETSPIKP